MHKKKGCRGGKSPNPASNIYRSEWSESPMLFSGTSLRGFDSGPCSIDVSSIDLSVSSEWLSLSPFNSSATLTKLSYVIQTIFIIKTVCYVTMGCCSTWIR